jgi:tetratricopeptide (TPR) repeat protein
MLGKVWIFLVAAMVLVAGCQAAKEKTSFADRGKVSVADVKFETSEDPPLKAQTRFAAGQLAESQGDYKVAVEQYWEAVKLEPKYKEALYRLGIVYCHLQHYPDAIVAWKEYIKATGGDATGYSNLGFCHELAGQFGEAEEAYKKGIAKDPTSNPCRVNYGLMLARNNRIAEATLQLQTVLTPAEIHYNLASVFEHEGRKAQARTEYRRALDADPNFADAEVRLSMLK